MYIKYSTRKFKVSHLERIKSLKDQYASRGTCTTQEGIVVGALDIGLTQLEKLLGISTSLGVRVEDNQRKRTAPMGIKDE